MKILVQAIRKIALDKSIPLNQILYNKNKDNTFTLLDTSNRDLFKLNPNGIMSRCQFDQGILEETFREGIFGDVSKIIEELYEEKFGGRKLVNIFKNVNDKIDVNDFKNELKSMLKNKFPNMSGEIDVFVDNNGREFFRKFKLKFIQDKQKLEQDLGRGNGKGKSKNSKGIFMNMPRRPTAQARKVIVHKSQKYEYDIKSDDLFIGHDKKEELNTENEYREPIAYVIAYEYTNYSKSGEWVKIDPAPLYGYNIFTLNKVEELKSLELLQPYDGGDTIYLYENMRDNGDMGKLIDIIEIIELKPGVAKKIAEKLEI